MRFYSMRGSSLSIHLFYQLVFRSNELWIYWAEVDACFGTREMRRQISSTSMLEGGQAAPGVAKSARDAPRPLQLLGRDFTRWRGRGCVDERPRVLRGGPELQG